MNMLSKSLGLLFLLISCLRLNGQAIHGEVLDMDDKKPVSKVSIENIYNGLSVTTDSNGGFVINATSGQLLEFRKGGYKTTRVRIPQGFVPPFFRIIISKGFSPLRDMYVSKDGRYDYRQDSIKFHDLYAHELDFPKLNGLDAVQHPFSAMSKKNRAIWAFQDDYAEFEKEKYVDRTFNDAIITKFTGLSGDSLVAYKRRFRPTYDQLHSMNDYTFYTYVKATVKRYRTVNRPVIGR